MKRFVAFRGSGALRPASHLQCQLPNPDSMSWAGLFNTEFWIDREAGIGAVLLMQHLPFYDEDAVDTLQGFERRVYEGL